MAPRVIATPEQVKEQLVEEYASGTRTSRYEGNTTRKMRKENERLTRKEARESE